MGEAEGGMDRPPIVTILARRRSCVVASTTACAGHSCKYVPTCLIMLLSGHSTMSASSYAMRGGGQGEYMTQVY